jgi:alginate O-acetyltransferase complex protein AlgJ
MRRPITNQIMVAVFVIALILPVFDMLTGWLPHPRIDENRTPSAFPEFGSSKASWRAFGPAFSTWFSDHMGMRGSLIAAYRRINQDLLDSADSVLTGKDGWLFLLRDTVDYPDRLPLLADLCGRNPFPEDELKRFADTIEANRRRVEALGSHYVLMIIPNKQSVHGEHLPSTIRCSPGPRRHQQLVAELLGRSPDFPMPDLARAFSDEAARGTQLWHLTDTHWDSTGAALGHRTLIDHIEAMLGRELPDPIAEGSLALVPMASSGWGLARMLGRVGYLRETATTLESVAPKARSTGNKFPGYARGPLRPPERFKNSRRDLPTALALHDSFFDQRFKSLLAESFSRTDFVWHRGHPDIDKELELIRQLKPDVVIHEMVERNLLHPYLD